jgi:hypothetical protein
MPLPIFEPFRLRLVSKWQCYYDRKYSPKFNEGTKNAEYDGDFESNEKDP